MSDVDKIVKALNRIAAALENATQTASPEQPQCPRCKGKGSWGPGADCPVCEGSGVLDGVA